MEVFEAIRDSFIITTDRDRINLDTVCAFLGDSYWANKRPRDIIRKTIDNSLCFSLLEGGRQVGFARVVTDYATFAYLCDVFIDENYRGRGLGTFMVKTVLSHPELQSLKRWSLATRDAHEVYRRLGFRELENPSRFMEIVNIEA